MTINLSKEKYTLRFDLNVRPCNLGEGQLEREGNFICSPCIRGYYLLEVPPPKTIMPCKACNNEMTWCLGEDRVGPK